MNDASKYQHSHSTVDINNEEIEQNTAYSSQHCQEKHDIIPTPTLINAQSHFQNQNMLSLDTAVAQFQNFPSTEFPYSSYTKDGNYPTQAEPQYEMNPNFYYPLYSPQRKPQTQQYEQDEMYPLYQNSQPQNYYALANPQSQVQQQTYTMSPTPHSYYYHSQNLSTQLPPPQQLGGLPGEDILQSGLPVANHITQNVSSSSASPVPLSHFPLLPLIDPSTTKATTSSNSLDKLKGFNNDNGSNNYYPHDSKYHSNPVQSDQYNTLICPYIDCKYRGTFQTVDYLRRHTKEQHITSNEHCCKGPTWGCGKNFKRPYQLVNHWKGRRSLLNCNVPQKILDKYNIQKDMNVLNKKLTRRRRKKSA